MRWLPSQNNCHTYCISVDLSLVRPNSVCKCLVFSPFIFSKVNECLKQQLDRLWHTTNIYMHPKIHEFAEKLTAKLPGDLKVREGWRGWGCVCVCGRGEGWRMSVIGERGVTVGCVPFLKLCTPNRCWLGGEMGFKIIVQIYIYIFFGGWFRGRIDKCNPPPKCIRSCGTCI